MYTPNQIHPKQKADVDGWSDEVFLNKAKITIDGKITNTAILLLGKPESLHYINHIGEIVWRLADKDDVWQVFTIPFLMTTTEVMHKIRNYPFKLFPKNSFLPGEGMKYDSEVNLLVRFFSAKTTLRRFTSLFSIMGS